MKLKLQKLALSVQKTQPGPKKLEIYSQRVNFLVSF